MNTDVSENFNFAKVTPEWMNKSYFEMVVRKMENDSQAQLLELEVSAGSKPGDNFASSIFRASIVFKSKFTKGEAKKLSVIIKTQMVGAEEVLVESPLFRNEMEMYGKVLPAIKSLWESVGDEDILSPRLEQIQ